MNRRVPAHLAARSTFPVAHSLVLRQNGGGAVTISGGPNNNFGTYATGSGGSATVSGGNTASTGTGSGGTAGLSGGSQNGAGSSGGGGLIQIFAGNASGSGATSGNGGSVTIESGSVSSASGTGGTGNISITVGTQTGTGASGNITITAGNSSSSSSAASAGTLNLNGGAYNGTNGSQNGGGVNINGGFLNNGTVSGTGGTVIIQSGGLGSATATGTVGLITVEAGSNSSVSGGYGSGGGQSNIGVLINGGISINASATLPAGGVVIQGGSSSSTVSGGDGGAVFIVGGNVTGAASGAAGGGITIQTGIPTDSGSTNNGGILTLQTQTPGGTGQSGAILIQTLSGAANQSGQITISTGAVTSGSNPSGSIIISTGTVSAGTRGTIQLTGNVAFEGFTSGAMTFAMPTTITPYTITWPSATGTGALVNNGSGTLAWSSGSGVMGNVTTVSTSTYAVLTTDGYLVCTGASATLTLPTAVGVKGKEYSIKHAGTSFTNLYTIATTSSQTIGNIAGGSYVLWTNQESLTIYSDGSNWQIKTHLTETGPNAYTPSVTGVGTATGVSFFWERHGSLMRVYGALTSGTTTAALATIPLPSGANILSTNLAITANTTSASGAMVGIAKLAAVQTAATQANVVTAPGTSTAQVYVASGSTTSQFIPENGSATGTVFVSGSITQIDFTVPISGFQP